MTAEVPRTINTPLSPGEVEVFRREKIQVVAPPLGGLIINNNLTHQAKMYVDENSGIVYLEDEDVRITVMPPRGQSSSILYMEADNPPIVVSRDGARFAVPISHEVSSYTRIMTE
jgi:hypothetical protein